MINITRSNLNYCICIFDSRLFQRLPILVTINRLLSAKYCLEKLSMLCFLYRTTYNEWKSERRRKRRRRRTTTAAKSKIEAQPRFYGYFFFVYKDGFLFSNSAKDKANYYTSFCQPRDVVINLLSYGAIKRRFILANEVLSTTAGASALVSHANQ